VMASRLDRGGWTHEERKAFDPLDGAMAHASPWLVIAPMGALEPAMERQR
jgi:hypothetical protein